jgi:hypothetical protein
MISRHDFGTGSTHRLVHLFPNNKDSSTRVQSQGSGSGNVLSGFLRDRHNSTLTGQGCTRILQDKTQAFFSVSGLHKGLLQTGFPTRLSLRENGSEWLRTPPPHGLLSLFYLHAPGLTLVTLGTACVPSVRLPPTTWEITGPSKKDLG